MNNIKRNYILIGLVAILLTGCDETNITFPISVISKDSFTKIEYTDCPKDKTEKIRKSFEKIKGENFTQELEFWRCSIVNSASIKKYLSNYLIVSLHYRADIARDFLYKVIVDSNGNIFEIPEIDRLRVSNPKTDTFINLIDAEVDEVSNPQEALELTALYIQLTEYAFPSSIHFVGDMNDIHLRNDEKLSKEITHAIKQPKVKITGNDFFVSLYTWSELGGLLIRWDTIVTDNGRLNVKSQILGEKIGMWGYEE